MSSGTSGITTFNGKKLGVPSVKVNSSIYTDVILERDGNKFNLKSYGSVSKSLEPAASLFSGGTLKLYNLEFNDRVFSNVELKYNGNLSFSLSAYDISLKTYETSYANRKTDADFAFNSAGIAYADIDNDGDDDVITGGIWFPANREDYKIENIVYQDVKVYINNNGEFTEDSSIIKSMPELVHTRKIVTADLNGDAYPDFAIADHGFDADPFPGADIHLLLSNIDGTYDTYSPDIIGFHHAIAAGDLDNEGDTDLLTSSGVIMLNNGDGTFNVGQNFFGPSDFTFFTLEIIDLNGDGYNEIIASGHTWKIPTTIYLGSEDGQYTQTIEVSNPTPEYGIVNDIGVEDLDNDGDLELIINMTKGPDNFYEGQQIMAIDLDEFLNQTHEQVLYTNDEMPWIDWLRYDDVNGDGYIDIMDDDFSMDFILFNQYDFAFGL